MAALTAAAGTTERIQREYSARTTERDAAQDQLETQSEAMLAPVSVHSP